MDKIKNLEKEILLLKTSVKKLTEENEKLLRKEFILRALMDNIPDTIYFKDLDSKFTIVNKNQAKLLGLPGPDDAVGKTDFDFFLADHAADAFKDEQEIIKTGKQLVNKLERIRSAEGEFKWVTSSKVPYKDEDGKIIGLVGITRDETKNYEAQEKIKAYAEELKLLNITKDKFFSIIAHDLKNPFNTILGFTSILLHEFDDMTDEEKKEFLFQIDKVSNYAYQLLENLLQWSRSQTGRINFSPVKSDLHKLINENVEAIRVAAEKKDVKLISNVNLKSYAEIDVNMINTAIRNMLTNAIKFSRSGGKVSINVSKDKDKWNIEVEDTGVGIPKSNLKKLFKLDEQVSTPGTNDEKGTGLGLLLCYEFIKAHHGDIVIDSKENVGTKVKINIPAKQKHFA